MLASVLKVRQRAGDIPGKSALIWDVSLLLPKSNVCFYLSVLHLQYTKSHIWQDSTKWKKWALCQWIMNYGERRTASGCKDVSIFATCFFTSMFNLWFHLLRCDWELVGDCSEHLWSTHNSEAVLTYLWWQDGLMAGCAFRCKDPEEK